MPRFEYFQTDSFTVISIFIKNTCKDNCKVSFTPTSLSVDISSPTNYTLDINTCHEIIPSQSFYNILSTQVEIKLFKKLQGLHWNSLYASEAQETIIPSTSPTIASTIPPPVKKKNWDAIANEAAKEEEEPKGEQALNQLFQSIYANATDEVKKAMMKSYTESNGTCLSTDWAKVGASKVEVTPPDGMTSKKFEI